MATRQALAQLAAAYEAERGVAVAIESVGGVDAARRVQSGEAFDAVFLAADAIDRLAAGGSVLAGSRVDLFRSGVSVAVRAGAALPDLSSEEGLKSSLLAARSIGYSTGPSGAALLKLFDQWGIAPQLQGRLVQAPAGVPVAQLVAQGDVELGFQQLSELLHVAGIAIAGPMPQSAQIVTVFSGAVCAASSQPEATRELLAFLASPAAAEAKRAQGMDPA